MVLHLRSLNTPFSTKVSINGTVISILICKMVVSKDFWGSQSYIKSICWSLVRLSPPFCFKINILYHIYLTDATISYMNMFSTFLDPASGYGNAWNDYHDSNKKCLCFIMNLNKFSFFHTCIQLKVKWP